MNAKLEYWLTCHHGWTAVQKDWPLITLGVVMMWAYEWYVDYHRKFWLAVLLLSLPMLAKLAVAVCVVGWRKAIWPQNDVRWFLPRH